MRSAGVYPSRMDSTPLDVGDVAPPFTLPDADGNPVSLSDFAGKPVIVYFYPAAMTPGCTTEACDFSSARSQTDDGGYTVLGISPDKPEKLASFRDKESLSVTLLSDHGPVCISAYGAYGEKKQYGRTVQRRHPIDVRHRAGRPASAGVAQRAGHRARRQGPQGTRSGKLTPAVSGAVACDAVAGP